MYEYDFNKLGKIRKLYGIKTIIFTNGCFDLFHAGHASLLQKCKQIQSENSTDSIIIVAVNCDKSIKKIKGENRPIIEEKQRLYMIQQFLAPSGGIVVMFDEETPRQLIDLIDPDIIVKGYDYKGKEKEVIGYSDHREILIADNEYDVSTSSIIQKILDTYGK